MDDQVRARSSIVKDLLFVPSGSCFPKAHKEGTVLRQYLKANFALSKGEFPHKMQF
jgi:hypothetical protein